MPAPRGRPPKPTEIKRRLGNPGGRPLPEIGTVTVLPAAIGTPEPPRPLGKAGRELWDRVWDVGATWISPGSDLDLVLLVCEQMDERMQLRVDVIRNKNPSERRALRALDEQITRGLSEIGFSPTARARLGVAEVRKLSGLEELMARRAARGS